MKQLLCFYLITYHLSAFSQNKEMRPYSCSLDWNEHYSTCVDCHFIYNYDSLGRPENILFLDDNQNTKSIYSIREYNPYFNLKYPRLDSDQTSISYDLTSIDNMDSLQEFLFPIYKPDEMQFIPTRLESFSDIIFTSDCKWRFIIVAHHLTSFNLNGKAIGAKTSWKIFDTHTGELIGKADDFPGYCEKFNLTEDGRYLSFASLQGTFFEGECSIVNTYIFSSHDMFPIAEFRTKTIEPNSDKLDSYAIQTAIGNIIYFTRSNSIKNGKGIEATHFSVIAFDTQTHLYSIYDFTLDRSPKRYIGYYPTGLSLSNEKGEIVEKILLSENFKPFKL